MCGLTAIVGGRWAEVGLIETMLDRLAHRGPDGAAVLRVAGAALGHRRLSIIDIEGGRQPIASEDGNLHIVCNGEIYNYRDLRAELTAKGHRFRTASDSEVILHLYEEAGEACVERLRGMFAFVIHDAARRRLFAARDHLGQKPLFYRPDGDGLALASEIKALLPLGNTARPDPEALLQYLALRIVAAPRTMFAGIAKLPPAHFLVFDARGLRVGRYWRPDYATKHAGGEAELMAALEDKAAATVAAHTVADVEVGAFLSGGLDSTLVLGLLDRHAPTRGLPTFTLGIPYRDYDEAPAARSVAERYGTEHHEERRVPSLRAHLPDLVHCLDEPSDPLSVCSWLLSRTAARRVKVVLGGDGGDELFGGYDRYYGNLYAGRVARLPRALRRAVLAGLEAFPDGAWYKSRTHQLKWLLRASLIDDSSRYAQSLGYFYLHEGLRAPVLGPALARPLDQGANPYAPIIEAYAAAAADHPLDRMLYADSAVRLPEHSVMVLDRTAMAHGLEARSPFMDHELVEWCARLPVNLKVKGRGLRVAERRLAAGYLPPDVLNRPKQGFASALPYLLRAEYAHLFEVFLRRSRLAEEGFLQQDGIDALRRAHAGGRADHGNRLWLLLNAEAWYRMYIDGVTRDAMHGTIADAPPPVPAEAA